MGGITDVRIFSDEEIRQQIAENYTRRGEYRDSYMTPAERKEVKDELLNCALLALNARRWGFTRRY